MRFFRMIQYFFFSYRFPYGWIVRWNNMSSWALISQYAFFYRDFRLLFFFGNWVLTSFGNLFLTLPNWFLNIYQGFFHSPISLLIGLYIVLKVNFHLFLYVLYFGNMIGDKFGIGFGFQGVARKNSEVRQSICGSWS